MTATIPAFVAKLWSLVEDAKTNQFITWSENGNSFMVYNSTIFSKLILPRYFKHNNMTSFIRQLNMYGFRKIANIDQGSLNSANEDLEFFHPYFVKGQPSLLLNIKRKTLPENNRNTSLNLISDITEVKEKQYEIDNKIDDIKRENTALWDEVLYLRQKYNKQQLVIKKLIQFLLAMITPYGNIKVKPKMPIYINNLFNNPRNLRAVENVPNSETEYHNKLCDGTKSILLEGDQESHPKKLKINASQVDQNDTMQLLEPAQQLLLDQIMSQQSPSMEIEVNTEHDNNADQSTPKEDLLNLLTTNILPSLNKSNMDNMNNAPISKKYKRVNDYNNESDLNMFDDFDIPAALKDHVTFSINPKTEHYNDKNMEEESCSLYNSPDEATSFNKQADPTVNNNYIMNPLALTPSMVVEGSGFDFDDVYDQIYDWLDFDQPTAINKNNGNAMMNSIQTPNTYNDERSLISSNSTNLKDLVGKGGLSLDASLLVDLMRNIENNDLDYSNLMSSKLDENREEKATQIAKVTPKNINS